MGYGSAGTPPWVDEENIDKERKERESSEIAAKLRALQDENETLKKRIKQLEDELQKLRK